MTQMRAAVLHKPGDIRLESVKRPDPQDGEVLIRVEACGVCGSDISRMLETGAHHMPLICGHEFSGYVHDVGSATTTLEPDELVVVPPLIPCFKCEQCLSGHFGLCERYDYFGSRRDGAYAQYVTVPLSNVVRVPAGLDPVAAAMADPATIALHALWKMGLRSGETVAVVGAGPIGLFAIQWARHIGAGTVIAVENDKRKHQMAVEAGAEIVAMTDAEAIDAVEGGVDVVVECSGNPGAEDLAPRLCRRWGRTVFVGIPHAPVKLGQETFERVLRYELVLRGSWNSYSAPFPGPEWRETLRCLANGDLRWKFMVTHDVGLDALPEIFRGLGSRDLFSAKVIFRPNLVEG